MALFTWPKQGLLRTPIINLDDNPAQLGCFQIQIQLSVATILNGIQANSSQRAITASEVLAKHDENYMPPAAEHAVEQAQRAQKSLKP